MVEKHIGVEDTIIRICKTCDIPYVEAFVMPTGIFISVDEGKNDNNIFSFIKRIKNRTIDLDKVSKVNDFSPSIYHDRYDNR